MQYKYCAILLVISMVSISCWKPRNGTDFNPGAIAPEQKVWGFKPIYGTDSAAKKISYTSGPRPMIGTGNIYAFQTFIFQIDPGFGIHVIDNTIPSAAARLGFIDVKGCSQISIKNNKLYTNSYDDLVVIDFSNLNNVKEFSRLKGVFTEYRYGSPIASPPSSGYYSCPNYTSLVVGWVKDSISKSCYK